MVMAFTSLRANVHIWLQGGILWFTDLAAADHSLCLPVTHTALVLLNLELGLGKAGPQPPTGNDSAQLSESEKRSKVSQSIVGGLHVGLNLLLLAAFPLVGTLPQAIFVFWIT
eukprot:SAG31_NODE_122_length_23797_cov_39.343812_19_plen_113_part_00